MTKPHLIPVKRDLFSQIEKKAREIMLLGKELQNSIPEVKVSELWEISDTLERISCTLAVLSDRQNSEKKLAPGESAG